MDRELILLLQEHLRCHDPAAEAIETAIVSIKKTKPVQILKTH